MGKTNFNEILEYLRVRKIFNFYLTKILIFFRYYLNKIQVFYNERRVDNVDELNLIEYKATVEIPNQKRVDAVFRTFGRDRLNIPLFPTKREAFIQKVQNVYKAVSIYSKMDVAFRFSVIGVLYAAQDMVIMSKFEYYVPMKYIETLPTMPDILRTVPKTKDTLGDMMNHTIMDFLTEGYHSEYVDIQTKRASTRIDYDDLFKKIMFYFSRFNQLEKTTSKDLTTKAKELSRQFFWSKTRNSYEISEQLYIENICKETLRQTGPKRRIIPGIINVESLLK